MKINNLYKLLFFSILTGYIIFYAPLGINETDGGFIDGLAWQILSGKQLYKDIFYVRPPLPIWWRALEIQLLPTNYAVLFERIFCYLKIGAASFFAADLLAKNHKKWTLATLGFIVSAHCYPPAAWHTIDGLLCGSIAFWCLFKRNEPQNEAQSTIFGLISGISIVATMLCKQSFYPISAVFFALIFFQKTNWKAPFIGFSLAVIAFFCWLEISETWSSYFFWVNSAGNSAELWQHGFLDFLRISPKMGALFLAAILLDIGWWKLKTDRTKWFSGGFLIAALMGGYWAQLIDNQSFTIPFAQSRLLFLMSFGYLIWRIFQKNWITFLPFVALFSLTWMASISWGYNLPILFSTPMIFGFWEILNETKNKFIDKNILRKSNLTTFLNQNSPILVISVLIVLFWQSYQPIYRDGNRSEMIQSMGDIFPKLSGIYSDIETSNRYTELSDLSKKFGKNLVVIPAFPAADYLLNQPPVLPVDWESSIEINGRNELIIHEISKKMPTILIERSYADRILTDPKYAIGKWVIEHFDQIETTPNFDIYQKK